MFVSLLLTLPFLALGVISLQTPTDQIPSAVLLFIPILVGGVAIPLINALKKALKWVPDPLMSEEQLAKLKRKNMWLSFAVSVVMAVVALLITGSLTPLNGDPNVLVSWLGLAFATSQLIYRSIQEKEPARLNTPTKPIDTGSAPPGPTFK